MGDPLAVQSAAGRKLEGFTGRRESLIAPVR
jgi:hypothetical protein